MTILTRRNDPEFAHRRVPRRASGVLLVALLAAALAGCSALWHPAPVRETYLLQPPLPAAETAARPGSLRVGVIRVAAPYRGRDFVFRTDALRFASNYYFKFLVDPAAMIADGTARALEAAHPFAQVTGPGLGVDAEWRLDGFVSALYADVRDRSRPVAEIDITYYLTPGDGSAQTPVWTREYRQRTPMRDATPQAYAAALNEGFGAILGELARDLVRVQSPAG
ncbi:MAG: ABC-type transport auxiliary lipoprotein family protein [Casimicrobiaceae bacterium]